MYLLINYSCNTCKTQSPTPTHSLRETIHTDTRTFTHSYRPRDKLQPCSPPRVLLTATATRSDASSRSRGLLHKANDKMALPLEIQNHDNGQGSAWASYVLQCPTMSHDVPRWAAYKRNGQTIRSINRAFSRFGLTQVRCKANA